MRPWPRAMPALITPFTSHGDLDREAHAGNVATMAHRGAAGVLVAGSTGEGPYLEAGERAALIAGARTAAPDLMVVCGINGESLRQAAAQITEATEAGADAVLVITPTTLVRGRTHLVESFFMGVADVADVPVLLYNVPGVTGWPLPTDSVIRLASHDRIVGLKDSGGDPTRLDDLQGIIADGFLVFAGASRVLTASYRAGAWGAITASANYALTDVALAASGDTTAQQRLTTLVGVVEPHGVMGTKMAAGLSGLEAGSTRLPLRSLDEESEDDIRAALGVLVRVSETSVRSHPAQDPQQG